MRICDAFGLPVLSLTDTPGFMVGPASEEQAAVRRMSNLFIAGASLSIPVVAIFLRKGYGLGAMAMVGGSFREPVYAAAWPTGEFGGMGLEGAVRLGFKKELEAEEDPEAASHLEIDAVIDPADTRSVVIRALNAASG